MTAKPERSPSGLGRGLSALIPQRSTNQPAPSEIPISRITRNPYQPRQRIELEALEALAASIAEHGVLQPILVTETLEGYQLIAGERRVRASQMAGLERIPAVVRQTADRDQLELALVENLQRADLNALEEAQAYRQLIDEFSFSQEQLAVRMGRARSTIANSLRLLDLEPSARTAIAEGRISEGHGRALGGLGTAAQVQLLDLVVHRGLSVRQTEELARRLRGPDSAPGRMDRPGRPRRAGELDRIEEDLRRALGTKVSLARSRKGGRIVIEYYSDEELSRLYERLTGGVA